MCPKERPLLGEEPKEGERPTLDEVIRQPFYPLTFEPFNLVKRCNLSRWQKLFGQKIRRNSYWECSFKYATNMYIIHREAPPNSKDCMFHDWIPWPLARPLDDLYTCWRCIGKSVCDNCFSFSFDRRVMAALPLRWHQANQPTAAISTLP